MIFSGRDGTRPLHMFMIQFVGVGFHAEPFFFYFATAPFYITI